jgi:uncharacterized repeat protein (TIGR03806 family)
MRGEGRLQFPIIHSEAATAYSPARKAGVRSGGQRSVGYWLCQCWQHVGPWFFEWHPKQGHCLWHAWAFLFLVAAAFATGCVGSSQDSDRTSSADDDNWPPEKLSSYGLFLGNGSTQQPAAGVIPYDINTPLFSDYTEKLRFIKLPPDGKIGYDETKVLDFPVGTVIAKTFAYPHNMRDPSAGRRLMETRILAHRPDGWVGLPYIWNEEQTEAMLDVAGDTVDVSWQHTDGTQQTNHYLIPNANQCKGCHEADGNDKPMRPLGPTARQLNREFAYHEGTENQLACWSRLGLFSQTVDVAQAPRISIWNDEATGTVDQRARAWLEINCAHCHNPNGPAKNSGLDLQFAQDAPAKFGVFKSPVAAGRGTGGRLYDIVPGKPDESILLYRIASDQPQVMMPELGKRLVHSEGVELIRQWIAEMPATDERPGGG